MENGSKMRLTIITGMSGAGKTVAVQCLEDMGYFCIDNLPPMLLLKFIEMIDQSQNKMDKIAVVMDLRGRAFFRHLSKALDEIAKKDWIIQKILFLEASDEVLIRRYKETRRNHPLAPHGRISEGIKRERALLSEIKGQAQIILDSSGLKPVQLKNKIQEHFSASNDDTFSVHIFSFGFKYGSPIDADLLFDVRFLPNPYYVEKLRILTGLDESVSSYVLKYAETKQFLEKFIDLLAFTLPYYQKEGKRQVVIGIGCTGGQHRSVTIAEYISRYFAGTYRTVVTHRDIEKRSKKENG
ncbi:MAG TPA: RNase adapter RapZ [Firmicutes bacterium]|nr:RNase adapter RapZ [Bacillota bacterium]